MPRSYTGDDNYIFISYAHADSEEVFHEIDVFNNAGLNVKFDDGIRPGESWREELGEWIVNCSVFVIYVTPNSMQSRHCLAELNLALEQDRKIIAVHLVETALSPGIHLALGDRQQVFKPKSNLEAYHSNLCEAIEQAMQDTSPFTFQFSVKKKRRSFRLLTGTVILMFAFAFAGLALFSYFEQRPDEDLEDQVHSVAVLPFLDLSVDKKNEYFSDGVSEQILNDLSLIPNLVVTARTSSFSLKNTQLDIPSIGRKLNVSRIIEGSVRRSADEVLISAKLIDATTGQQIWSSQYREELTNIFDVQRAISMAIVSELEPSLLGTIPVAEATTPNVEAYDLYLLGRFTALDRTVGSITRAISLYEQSIDADPDFVLAYIGLANAHNLLAAYGNYSGPEAAAKMKPLLQTAQSLDPNLAELHNSLAVMYYNLGELDASEAAYLKAIELNPNFALAHMWLGNQYISQSRLIDAAVSYRRALSLDPLNTIVNINMARVEFFAGNVDRGLEKLNRAVELSPNSAAPFARRSYWQREYGLFDLSLEDALTAIEIDENGAQNLVNLIEAYAAVGDFDSAEHWISLSMIRSPDNWQVIDTIASYYFLAGNNAELERFTQKTLDRRIREEAQGLDLKAAYFWAAISKISQRQYELAIAYLLQAKDIDIKIDTGSSEARLLNLLVYSYRQVGNSTMADSILQENFDYISELQEQGWNTPRFRINEAVAYALAGDRENTAASLQTAIDLGYKLNSSRKNDPIWLELLDDELRQLLTSAES